MAAEPCVELEDKMINELLTTFIQIQRVLITNYESCKELERQRSTLLESVHPRSDLHNQVEYLLCRKIDCIQLHICMAKARLELEDGWSADDYKHPGDVKCMLIALTDLLQWVSEAVICMKFEVRKEGGEECPICMQALKQFRVTPCSHHFHTCCLFQWLTVSEHKSCPMCRSNLLPHFGKD